jgi:malonyl-CoA O-methyltransferase
MPEHPLNILAGLVMANEAPPTIDPVAAAHWQRVAPPVSPWLHEEVGRRMEDRLQWIRLEPRTWADWEPVRGGVLAHGLVERRYPKADCLVVEHDPARARAAQEHLGRPWWRRWSAPAVRYGPLPDGAAQMLWANMALHMSAQPQALLADWHRALAPQGFLMFSCLGPDTVRELRSLYAQRGWPSPAHEFTDMHDWGDMLAHAGFADPVMDMERITLTWDSAPRALQELRELGANLHPGRFAAARSRAWRARLEQSMDEDLRDADGRIALTFEIIYGHAVKPQPRVKLSAQASVSLQDMRSMLRPGRTNPD